MKKYTRKEGSTFDNETVLATEMTANVTLKKGVTIQEYQPGDYAMLYMVGSTYKLGFVKRSEFEANFDLNKEEEVGIIDV